MTVYGYARGEELADQVQRLSGSGCARVFFDTSHGGALGYGWTALVDALQSGDTVRFVSPDRVSRSAERLGFVTETLGRLGVGFEFLE